MGVPLTGHESGRPHPRHPAASPPPSAPTYCRGFGTVRFGSKEDAESATAKVNNTEMDGRTITVRLDRFA